MTTALFNEYLDEWVYGVKSHEEYLGKSRKYSPLFQIKANPVLGYAVGLDRK